MTCYTIHVESGAIAFVCGRLGPHCAEHGCSDVGVNLCDYAIGDDVTCSRPICPAHSFNAAPGIDYCPGHAVLWREFKERQRKVT